MIVYIDRQKTYCIGKGGQTAEELGTLLFRYYKDGRDSELNQLIENVFFKEGSPMQNYVEYSAKNHNRYCLQAFRYPTFLLGDYKKIHLAYEVTDDRDLIIIELVHLIRKNSKIRTCRRCNRLFIAKNNHNANYCDRLDETLGVPCSKLGSAEAYREKLTKNPILQEYQKAYKRLYARMRNGKIEQAEFDEWVRNITIERDILAEKFNQTGDFNIVNSFIDRIGNKKKY